jgi:Rrf2 family nitric oxide-sensitive transcriptional repressor
LFEGDFVQLTQFTDYSLRLALYLATHPGRTVTIQEVSSAYGISAHHLKKVTHHLIELGIVSGVRGRGGGVRLAQPPEAINVGQMVRLTEPHSYLVECFDQNTNTCPIDPACGLKGVLVSAQQAFFRVLDAHTLADFLPRAPALIRLWRREKAG